MKAQASKLKNKTTDRSSRKGGAVFPYLPLIALAAFVIRVVGSWELIRNDPETNARRTILSDYPYVTEGERRYYSCNALCFRIPPERTAASDFAGFLVSVQEP